MVPANFLFVFFNVKVKVKGHSFRIYGTNDYVMIMIM